MAGGIPAGRLSIEIVAEIARLQADLDKAKRAVSSASADINRSARAANDNLANVGKGIGDTFDRRAADIAAYGTELDKLRAKYNPLYAAVQRYKQAQAEIRQAHKVGAISADEMAAALSRERQATLATMGAIRGRAGAFNQSSQDVTKTAGLQRHHIQNLTFQFQDLGVQMAAAAGSSAPLKMALMALFQQGSQIQGIMMQAGIGVKAFAGELLALAAPFAPLVIAVGVLAGVIGLMTAGINENAKVHVTWGDTLLGTFDAIGAALTGSVKSAFDAFGINTTDVWKTVLEWAKWAANRIIGVMSLAPRLMIENFRMIPAAVADIFFSATNVTVDAVNAMIRKAVEGINGLISQANRILGKAGLEIPTITAPQIARHQGAAAKLAKGIGKTFTDTLERDFIGDMAAAVSPYAQARAVKRMEDDAKKAGKKAGEKAGKAAKESTAKVFDIEAFAAKQLAETAKDIVKDLTKEAEADWKAFQDRIANIDKYNTEVAILNAKAREDAYQAVNDQLRDMIGLLGNAGRVGGGIGALLGLVSGNSSAIGGKLGALLNMNLGYKTGSNGEYLKDDKGQLIAKTIGGEISKIFKKDGAFTKALQPVLQNAGLGMSAASSIFGKQSTSEQIGSAIGGALGGSKIVEKSLSKGLESIAKGLGDFAGPLGSIVGGVLGNVLGGLFTSVKWGRATVSASGVSQSGGNNDTSQKAALAAGNSVLDGLKDLATALGGAIGDFGNITVGVRHGDYRVNTSGTSLKVKKGATDFNDDAEAAVAYAMKVAIERGAITGIRESTNRLLKAGTDLQTQLNKALSFEGVFSELKSRLDPVGYELDNLTREFDQLRAVFAEAGATAEEYAQLEQLLTLKRKEALDKEQDALNDIKSRIAEALGDDATVTAIARAKELRDATSDAQREELQRLYAIEDQIAEQAKLTEAMEQTTTAAEQMRQAWESTGKSIRDEIDRIRGITGGNEGASFATLQGRFNAALAAAKAGDHDAAGKLVDLSQSLIDAAGKSATSRQELDRVKAETAASLEAIYNVIGTISGNASASGSSSDGLTYSGTGSTGSASSASNSATNEIRALREELAKLREEMNNGHAAIAGNTGRMARKLDDVTAASGGSAVSVTGAAA